MKKSHKTFLNKKNAPYIFIAPVIAIFAIFEAYPFVYSMALSFQKFDRGEDTFVGINNYLSLLKDPVFRKALWNTCLYLVVQVPVMVALSLALAVFLEAKLLRGRSFFRISLFLPAIIALVAYSMVFKLLLNYDYGFVNYLLSLVNIPKVDWLNTPLGAKAAIMIAITWRWTGYNMIIMLAWIQGIPESLYESAEIDGAGEWKKFWLITVPMMKPIILFASVTSTIGTFQLFDESYVLTGGGPNMATITMAHYLYDTAFKYFNFGYAAAISFFLMIIIMVLSLIQFKITGDDMS
jgi:lactose/L-arabinose transport system permease protein